jgi:hypothetical protein
MTDAASSSEERKHASSRRINRLAQIVGARRYLEIGVRRGVTFCKVQITEKVGVDPEFVFDIAERPPNERFYTMTSDTWFEKHSDVEPFDIIFLDGLHTFDQTLRDFCNSLFVAHSGTIWLIDDTVPSDYYAAWPDQKLATRIRQTDLGNHPEWPRSRAWQGDVFKVVFALHDFFPKLTYRTITTQKPQTLVWRQTRGRFLPVLNSMEAIARMSYFDFRHREDVMRRAREELIFDEIERVFARTKTERTYSRNVPWNAVPAEASGFVAPDPLAVYELSDQDQRTKLLGGLEWLRDAPGVSVVSAGAVELSPVVGTPATVVLEGGGAHDPFGFFELSLAFDECNLSGRFEMHETGKWNFLGMTANSPKNGSAAEICTLAIARRSGGLFPDGLSLERVSIFAQDRAPKSADEPAPIATVFDPGFDPGSKGWYLGDALRNGGYCWMGPVGTSALRLRPGLTYRLCMPEARPLTEDLLSKLQITLGGVPMTVNVESLPHEPSLFHISAQCTIPDGSGENPQLRISFPEESVRSPRELGLNEDRRRISIAVRRIAIGAIT